MTKKQNRYKVVWEERLSVFVDADTPEEAQLKVDEGNFPVEEVKTEEITAAPTAYQA